MAINLTRAWTASTLTPGLRPVSSTATAAQVPQSNNALSSIMSAIFGGNYQNLLGASNQQQGPAATSVADRAYANFLNSKSAAIDYASRMEDVARANSAHLAATPRAVAGQGFLTGAGANNPALDYFSRYQEQANSAANRWSAIAQQAALSPAFAPSMQNSVGPQNVGPQWNPFAASGWVSPAQAVPSRGADSARNLMALGV